MVKKCAELDFAKSSGESRYFTGKPCKHGHIAQRVTASRTCIECIRAYSANFRLRNPNKLKEWILNNRERHALVGMQWKHSNKEKVREYGKREYVKNKARKSIYAAKWRLENADRFKEMIAEWARKNPERRTANAARRRAILIKAIPSWADHEQMSRIYAEAAMFRKWTCFSFEIDHIVPLVSKVVCGLHCQNNMRVCLSSENRRKSNRSWPDMPG